MTLKDFKLLLVALLFSLPVIGQIKLSGYITNGSNKQVIANVQIYDTLKSFLETSAGKL